MSIRETDALDGPKWKGMFVCFLVYEKKITTTQQVHKERV